jgi:hypothetical protein
MPPTKCCRTLTVWGGRSLLEAAIIVKLIFIFVIFAVLNSVAASQQQACASPSVRPIVSLAGNEFTLADLLDSDACPDLVQRAAHVHLGAAPLSGTTRVLKGDEVRARFAALLGQKQSWTGDTRLGAETGAIPAGKTFKVPERITVQRAGGRASCGTIGRQILEALPALEIPYGQTLECGAAGRIPEHARMELTGAVWNSALHSWDVSARCANPTECVPFLVRISGNGPAAARAASTVIGQSLPPNAAMIRSNPPVGTGLKRDFTARTSPPPSDSATLLVRPGETVTFSWEGAGIRLLGPVVCLDRGRLGDQVRVRMLHGGRVLPAIVAGAGQLRAVI